MKDKQTISTIRAFLRDYPRRKALAAAHLEQSNGEQSESLRAFMAWNERIDKAFTVIDEPLRVGMFQDIASGKGYKASPLRERLTIHRYHAAKNKVLESLARELNLILI
ncbi:MAG: hypothetical protein IJV85_01210 [Clostridia bacterium]|nr:hypothetical protein [Clostridia bacterium]